MLGYCERNIRTRLIKNKRKYLSFCWSSINEVTEQGKGAGERFCDESTRALVIKSVTTGGGGIKNVQNLLDVIYGRPLLTCHEIPTK
jgi:hypothetical protein